MKEAFNRWLAAMMFFTRLPWWRLGNPPKEYFSRVVELWPYIGWLTGGVTAGLLWLFSGMVPPHVAVILALTGRLLLTGALHEDGLADFCDGFGGGVTRDRILLIMKDSHIGTYGVIGLVIYYLLAIGVLGALPLRYACLVVFAADGWSKCCASELINFLGYARTEATAKNRVVYARMSVMTLAVNITGGLVPLIILVCESGVIAFSALAPIVVVSLGILFLNKKIGGYTGDCCGAIFLISEMTMWLVALIIWRDVALNF